MTENVQQKTKAEKIFEWSHSIYILSLLIVIPFMTWKDTAYVVGIALIGYGLGKWKREEYEAHILPLVVAYIAAKPFLHYGTYPTDWSWQRYVVLTETALLGVILLVTRSVLWLPPCRKSQENCMAPVGARGFDSMRFFPAAILFAFAGLTGSCTVPYLFGQPLTADLLPLGLAAVCFAAIYTAFVHSFLLCKCKQ